MYVPHTLLYTVIPPTCSIAQHHQPHYSKRHKQQSSPSSLTKVDRGNSLPTPCSSERTATARLAGFPLPSSNLFRKSCSLSWWGQFGFWACAVVSCMQRTHACVGWVHVSMHVRRYLIFVSFSLRCAVLRARVSASRFVAVPTRPDGRAARILVWRVVALLR